MVTSVRVSQAVLAQLDSVAAAIGARAGVHVCRSEVTRMALGRGLAQLLESERRQNADTLPNQPVPSVTSPISASRAAP